MSRPVAVEFSSALRKGQRTGSPPFQVVGAAASIQVHGSLSAGTRGWTLSASALIHRRKLTLYVTARQTNEAPLPDVEDHVYEATLSDLRPGRYELHVAHLFTGPRLGVGVQRQSIYGTVVSVGCAAVAPARAP